MGHPEPHHGAGLVHHIDGLVRQRAVGNIAVGLLDAGLERFGGIFDIMEILVILPEVAQDVDGLGYVRGFHDHLEETAVKRPVLFNDLGEFVHGRGADALDLAARQRRLEHVGGVEAALGAAGTHDSVELIYEKDDVGVCFQVFDDALQPLFEIAPVARSGHD